MQPMTRALTTIAIIAAVTGAALGCHDPATGEGDRVSSLSVSPVSLALAADDSAPLVATAVTAAGSTLVASRIGWYSSDTSVAPVSTSGQVRALRRGTATITASAGGKVATSLITTAYAPLTGVRLYAHRGFGTVFPENTLIAADSAFARGADGVESDVQLTSDSVAVIIHDATVDRTTNGTGAVNSLTLAQIRALDACSKKGVQWAPCQIPLAEEMIQKVRGRGLLILDLKGPWPDSQLRNLLGMVRASGMTSATMVTSFQIDHLRRTRRLDPRITLGWLMGDVKDPTPALDLGKAAIIPEEGLMRKSPAPLASFDSLLIARGSILGAWTIYSPNVVPTLKTLGVRWFIAGIPLDKSTLTGP